EDWGEAPHVNNVYGREKELEELERWIINDRCQMVAVLGIGGMGKTTVVGALADHLKDEFEYIFWRSLQHAPPLGNILEKCILFLSSQQRVDLPKETDKQISLFIEYLRVHRCLLVLDNVESILQTGDRAGYYRDGYEGYGEL